MMMRLIRLAGFGVALLIASPAHCADAFDITGVEAGLKAAGIEAAGPKPFVDIVCPIMQQQAEARGSAADALRAPDLAREPLQSATP